MRTPIYKLNDQNFFKLIDSSDKAYILGLLWADGHNNVKRGTIMLSLRESDKDILLKLLKIFYPLGDKKLLFDNKQKHNQNWSNQFKLTIHNKTISQDLLKLGMVNNKTYDCRIPVINEEFYSDFIRGLFDGDGHFYIDSDNDCTFGITGHVTMLAFVQNIFKKTLDLNPTKLSPSNHPDIKRLRYGGIHNTYKIFRFLYQDAHLFLARKHATMSEYYGNNAETLARKRSKYPHVWWDTNRNKWGAENKKGKQKRFPSEELAYEFSLSC